MRSLLVHQLKKCVSSIYKKSDEEKCLPICNRESIQMYRWLKITLPYINGAAVGNNLIPIVHLIIEEVTWQLWIISRVAIGMRIITVNMHIVALDYDSSPDLPFRSKIPRNCKLTLIWKITMSLEIFCHYFRWFYQI